MKKTGIKVITNNLAGYKSNGQLVPAKRVMVYDGINMVDVKGILANENLKTVWDAEEYLLEANDTIELESSGGNVETELNIISKCFKFDGSFDWVKYNINPSTIPSNTTNKEKEYLITITQEKSGLEIKSTCIQAADEYLSTVYSEPVVTHVEAEVADAWGSDVVLLVSYTQKVTHYYGSGSVEETISDIVNPTITSGSAKISNVTRNGKYIKVPSAGTDPYSSPRTVYIVTGYSFTVNGKTKNVNNVSISVKQEPNVVISYYYGDYVLSITSTDSIIPANNYNTLINVVSNRKRYNTYTSGDTGEGIPENVEAILSTSDGTIRNSNYGQGSSSTTIMGGRTAYFIAHANESVNSRYVTVYAVSSGNSSLTDSITFTQYGASYEFKVSPSRVDGLPASGGDATFTVISTVDESITGYPRVSTDNSQASVGDIIVNDILNDRYNVTISVLPNSSTSTRYINVTFVQPGSGETRTSQIIQLGKQSGGGSGNNSITISAEATWMSDNEVSATATFDGTAQAIEVYSQIEDESGRVLSNVEYSNIIVSIDMINTTFMLSEHYEPCYFVIYDSNDNSELKRVLVK